MQELSDMALLREYADHESEEAFATLVTRHVNKVYSVALRHTRNPHQAEEITQAVFAILARKSRHLGNSVILSGWLYQTARLTAVTFIRSEIRRARREQEAHMQTLLNESESGLWAQIAPLLDTAMAGLGDADRHAVVLRFFDGKSMKEVGLALGVSEDAAKMRLNRAVEKMRGFFAKRGVVLPAAALTAAISANSVQAAPAVLAKTATAAAFAKGATASTSTLTLIKGALKLMAWTQAKTAIFVSVGALVVTGAAAVTITAMRHAPEPSAVVTPPDVAPAAQPDNPIPPSSPQEQMAPAVAPPVPQAPTKAVVATLRNPSAELIYPTAPRISTLLAAAKAAGTGNGGFISVPADLSILNQYGNLFQMLQLTQDQIDAFIKIMEDKQAQSTAILRANRPFDPNSPVGPAGIQELLLPAQQAADSQIKQLLGSDDSFKYYQTYADQQKERTVLINGYADGIDAAGVAPLTLNQVEQLVSLFYQTRLAAGGDSDIQSRQFPQTLQQAASFLSSDQIRVLTQYTLSLLSPSSSVGTVVGMGGGAIGIGAAMPPPGN